MTLKAAGKRTSEFRQLKAIIAKGQITKCSQRCQITPRDTLHNCRLKNLISLALCSMPKHSILKVCFLFVCLVSFCFPSCWNSFTQEVVHFVIFKVVFKMSVKSHYYRKIYQLHHKLYLLHRVGSRKALQLTVSAWVLIPVWLWCCCVILGKSLSPLLSSLQNMTNLIR